MQVLLLAFSVLLAVFSLFIICVNWSIFWRRHVMKSATTSWLPLIGGGVGAVGVLLFPGDLPPYSWMVPLIIDWGCVPGFAFTAWWYLSRKEDRDTHK